MASGNRCCAAPQEVLRFRKLIPDYSNVSGEDLIRLCADGGNAPAWEEFLRRYHHVIVAAVLRTSRHYTDAYSSLCDDLAQEVYLKLSAEHGRVLRQFQPRHPGSELAYFSVVAANVVHDYFKKKSHRLEGSICLENVGASGNAGPRLLERDVDDVLCRKVRENKIRESERGIFWLYYRWGMTSKEIAAIPSLELTIKGVESVLNRLRGFLRAEF